MSAIESSDSVGSASQTDEMTGQPAAMRRRSSTAVERQEHQVQVQLRHDLSTYFGTILESFVAVAIRKGNLKNSQNGFSDSSTLVSAGDIIGKSLKKFPILQ